MAVHPIVLLSVVDHFKRVCQKNKNKRVVGALLGEASQGHLDVTNCYAIPFEEDPKDPNIFFLDHTYHEQMTMMFRKVNAKEKLLGWYTTAPRANDSAIHAIFAKYSDYCVKVSVDPDHQDVLALPVEAFIEIQTVQDDGSLRRKFQHVESSVEAFEPEEIGVESLLREIKNISLNSLHQDVILIDSN